MKIFASIAVILLGVGLSACHNPSSTVMAKTHVYTLKQKCPALMEMKVGESLVFNASENPSTGYQWQLAQPLKIFKTEETFLQKDAENGAVGEGGIKTFQFTAEKPGQDLIELVHVRSWESSKQPDQRWQCRIRVS
ncbi:protease inhibitor I42 family protein [Acinetobacter sp. ANC 4648]|uniref:protease inhibitor I42 family protein n=1 Tax=Acinetobacter sp. ANC 4648 TaxID=1977875 RepID=UPI000A333ED4|nr:protease inhibitor I42 family protein [Acinetobacter sp. ANC 4648]OTG80660.1 peptidase [Acinetobacter sp. ANC 4648]